MSLLEKARIARLAASRAQRLGAALLLGSAALRWRYGAPVAEELAMVPQELRPADVSFFDEIEQGYFGLDGIPATILSGSPFAVFARDDAWKRALHGFGWLRHLAAADREGADSKARALILDWIDRSGWRDPVARLPEVGGRRLISWIANAGMLLEGVDQATFDRIAQCLGDQLVQQSAVWPSAADGHARLVALLGVVYGDLCVLGHERHLAASEAQLAAELKRQILPDGGHASRNSAVVLDLLLDLLPLRQCFVTRGRPVPAEIDAAIARMQEFLRFMQLGDGTLARFNGVGPPTTAELSTVLAYGSAHGDMRSEAPQSAYVRLARGDLLLIADIGSPPPLALAGSAQAGALSFELSSGAQPLLINCGMPGPADAAHAAAARATSSHNALCLGDKSSARLVREAALERMLGAPPLQADGTVTGRIEGEGTVAAHTDAYAGGHGVRHARRLALTADGSALEGHDRIAGIGPPVRFATDVPFAVHFHLAPGISCNAGQGIELTLRDGTPWRFTASGAEITVEPSLHFADPRGPVKALQIVLRGSCWGETDIRWRLARTDR